MVIVITTVLDPPLIHVDFSIHANLNTIAMLGLNNWIALTNETISFLFYWPLVYNRDKKYNNVQIFPKRGMVKFKFLIVSLGMWLWFKI